ncbi:MAG: hypothetical protein E7363_02825 [Clostridiales bacterium]|nr:hypothetical protein [Clostridiales bacterium]
MAKFLFLAFTALSVSLDSFFCGFSLTLSIRADKKTSELSFHWKILLCVLTAVTLLCTLAFLLGNSLRERQQQLTLKIGGGLLFIMGVVGLLKAFCENSTAHATQRFLTIQNNRTGFLPLFSAGLGVGTDGAVAVFSLSVMGYGGLISAFTVIACHALLTDLGAKVAFLPKDGILPHLRICAPVILIFLALSRLM